MCKKFEDNELNIPMEGNKDALEFIDLTLDLWIELYEPNKKAN